MAGEFGVGYSGCFDGIECASHTVGIHAYFADNTCFSDHFDSQPIRFLDFKHDEILSLPLMNHSISLSLKCGEEGM
jgi:hypothetical protein